MRREEHVVGETFSYRFPGKNADHALLIEHGLGGHGGIYDNFGAYHAAQGVDVWSMDAPGHGRSCISQRRGQFTVEEWVEDTVMYGRHIAEVTGLPVVVKGSSMGAAAAYGALAAAPDVFAGAVLMGYGIPSSPFLSTKPESNPFRTDAYRAIEKQYGANIQLNIERFFDFDEDYGFVGADELKHDDPLNTWAYDIASWASLFTYDPVVPLADNTKPILFTVGELDSFFTPEIAQVVVDATGGDPEFYIHKEGTHQLMLFHTAEYSKVVIDWCRKTIAKEG